MNTQNELVNKEQKVFIKKDDEKILVIQREKLFARNTVHGFTKIDFNIYQNLIENHKEFLWRSQVETNPNYKQIIPYLTFNFKDKFFLMRRKSDASEVRLQNKFSLGIGGHIRQEDVQGKSIADWAIREFNEEIDYQGSFEIQPLGLLNDESDSVGQVHTGFVFLLKGNSDKIKIRSELKEGQLLTLFECVEYYHRMENWSKIIFDFLSFDSPIYF